MRTTKTVSKALTACAAISLSLGLGMGAANAIPPGGASENTPGTSSTVSPHVTPGGVVNFTLTGFPENTQVTVKLDDDGVVHRQTTDSKGNLNGSFVLSNAGSGDHTLRFLATGGGGGKDANGRNKGNTGGRYTNKSPVFTVGEPDNGGRQ